MTLTAAFGDLASIAQTIEKEAQLIPSVAAETSGCWDDETSRLVANSYASGMAQILQAQRVLMLEAIAMEQAAALSPA